MSPKEWEMDRIMEQMSLGFGIQDWDGHRSGEGSGCPEGNGRALGARGPGLPRDWPCWPG